MSCSIDHNLFLYFMNFTSGGCGSRSIQNESMIITKKRMFTDLSDEECFKIAVIITDNCVQTLSRVDRSKSIIDRIEIYCDDETEKIDIQSFKRIDWKENHSGRWESVCIFNYSNFIEYLFEIGVMALDSRTKMGRRMGMYL